MLPCKRNILPLSTMHNGSSVLLLDSKHKQRYYKNRLSFHLYAHSSICSQHFCTWYTIKHLACISLHLFRYRLHALLWVIMHDAIPAEQWGTTRCDSRLWWWKCSYGWGAGGGTCGCSGGVCHAADWTKREEFFRTFAVQVYITDRPALAYHHMGTWN